LKIRQKKLQPIVVRLFLDVIREWILSDHIPLPIPVPWTEFYSFFSFKVLVSLETVSVDIEVESPYLRLSFALKVFDEQVLSYDDREVRHAIS
jgi:hypothetical protein